MTNKLYETTVKVKGHGLVLIDKDERLGEAFSYGKDLMRATEVSEVRIKHVKKKQVKK